MRCKALPYVYYDYDHEEDLKRLLPDADCIFTEIAHKFDCTLYKVELIFSSPTVSDTILLIHNSIIEDIYKMYLAQVDIDHSRKIYQLMLPSKLNFRYNVYAEDNQLGIEFMIQNGSVELIDQTDITRIDKIIDAMNRYYKKEVM